MGPARHRLRNERNDNMAGKSNTEATFKIRLPRQTGPNAEKDAFFSVNGQNYIIQRGIEVDVPAELYEVIQNGLDAEMQAMDYSDERIEVANR